MFLNIDTGSLNIDSVVCLITINTCIPNIFESVLQFIYRDVLQLSWGIGLYLQNSQKKLTNSS